MRIHDLESIFPKLNFPLLWMFLPLTFVLALGDIIGLLGFFGHQICRTIRRIYLQKLIFPLLKTWEYYDPALISRNLICYHYLEDVFDAWRIFLALGWNFRFVRILSTWDPLSASKNVKEYLIPVSISPNYFDLKFEFSVEKCMRIP